MISLLPDQNSASFFSAAIHLLVLLHDLNNIQVQQQETASW
jgi:hypothetical protein